jgi:mono/diheme cytochrome c family protein
MAVSLAAPAQRLQDQVHKILAEKCLSCHCTARMSGLELSTRESIVAGGRRGPALVPGKPSESLLYKAVARESDLQMPPGKTALSPEQIRVIGEWISAGAPSFEGPQSAVDSTWWSLRNRSSRLGNRSTI